MTNRALYLILMTLTFSSAQAYQYEVDLGLNLAYTELEVNGDASQNSEQSDGKARFHLNGKYFLEDVKTEGLPLDEAAFLGKASSVAARINYSTQYDTLSYRFDDGTYGRAYGITLRAVVDDYILRTTYDKFNGTSVRSILDGVDQSRIQIGVGRYISANTKVVISYINNEDDRDYVPNIGTGIVYREDEGIDGLFRTYMKLEGGQSLAYGGNLSLMDTTVRGQGASGFSYVLGGNISYYPINNLTLRGRLVFENFSDNNYEIKKHLLNLLARYYFNEAISMNVNLGHVDGKDELGKVNGAILGLGIRFRF